jgi:hypothetical protein
MTAARKHRRILAASGLLLLVLFGAGCSSDKSAPGAGADGGGAEGGGSSGPSTVAGTITLPADATGRCAMIAIDDDATPENGTARRPDGSYLATFQLVSGKSVAFSFDRIPGGAYYLWAYVDVDASASSPPGNCEIDGAPTSGDQFAYYGGAGMSRPSAPNVAVPPAASAYDFALSAIP